MLNRDGDRPLYRTGLGPQPFRYLRLQLWRKGLIDMTVIAVEPFRLGIRQQGPHYRGCIYMAQCLVQKGVSVYFLTPIARRKFIDGIPVDTHGDYPKAMKDVADGMKPLTDRMKYAFYFNLQKLKKAGFPN